MEKGAEVNAYGNYSVTCLGWAAGRGNPEIVRDLIQHGAKVNTGDKVRVRVPKLGYVR
jgi:ankyrin repeat-rich membrane spanning protein